MSTSKENEEDRKYIPYPDYKDYANVDTAWIDQRKRERLAEASKRSGGGTKQKFPLKLHAMLESVEGTDHASIVSWLWHGRAFKVYDKGLFEEQVLPVYFRYQGKFSSFQQQLNLYNFRRLPRDGPDQVSYYHEYFLRGRSELCTLIPRNERASEGVRNLYDPDTTPDFDAMVPIETSKAKASLPEEGIAAGMVPTHLLEADILTTLHNSSDPMRVGFKTEGLTASDYTNGALMYQASHVSASNDPYRDKEYPMGHTLQMSDTAGPCQSFIPYAHPMATRPPTATWPQFSFLPGNALTDDVTTATTSSFPTFPHISPLEIQQVPLTTSMRVPSHPAPQLVQYYKNNTNGAFPPGPSNQPGVVDLYPMEFLPASVPQQKGSNGLLPKCNPEVCVSSSSDVPSINTGIHSASHDYQDFDLEPLRIFPSGFAPLESCDSPPPDSINMQRSRSSEGSVGTSISHHRNDDDNATMTQNDTNSVLRSHSSIVDVAFRGEQDTMLDPALIYGTQPDRPLSETATAVTCDVAIFNNNDNKPNSDDQMGYDV